MTHTVEDTLEVLAGIHPRLVNIRIDYNEKHIIKSIAKQVFNKVALTDRQLELAIKKIEKYKDGLKMNNIDVDLVINNKPLRMPIREIDRAIRVGVTKENNKAFLTVKFSYSKKFENTWIEIKSDIIGLIMEKASVKEMLLTEHNIIKVIEGLQTLDPIVDQEILDLYEKIKEVSDNPNLFIPHASYENGKVILKNINTRCLEHINLLSSDVTENVIKFSDRLKNYGIYYKSQDLVNKINELTQDKLVSSIVINPETRFKFDSTKYDIGRVIEIVDTIDQWPLLVVVEENDQTFNQVKAVIEALTDRVPKEKITVFFRLDKSIKNHNEFNQYVKDNKLNNFIDETTQVVVVSKNKIPKPLVRSKWRPYCAFVMNSHYYGKISAFLDDFAIVYYYNNSIFVKQSKFKGARPIVEL